jgi:hypothetical protein
VRPALLAALLLAAPLAPPDASADDKVAAKLQATWYKAARKAGLSPEKTDDHQLLFKRQLAGVELTWVIHVQGEDPDFFRVTIPQIYQVQDHLDRLRVTSAANHATAMIKVAKVYVVDDSVWVSAEQLLPRSSDARLILDRTLIVMADALSVFIDALKGDDD